MSTDEPSSFRNDDLEFRTVTTLLNLLGSRDELKLENSQVNSTVAQHLKLLASVSAMLVMNHEVIAILPKRSANGLTMFIGSEPDPMDRSASLHFVTKNPTNVGSTTGNVRLMDIPTVVLRPDVFQFIVQNWSQSFEHHAQATAKLIAACFSGGETEWLNLVHYSIIQSAPKVARRFASTVFLEVLTSIRDADFGDAAGFPGFSAEDKLLLYCALEADETLAQAYPILCAFLQVNTSDPGPNPGKLKPLLQEFHALFIEILYKAKGRVDALTLLRKNSKTPPDSRTLASEVEMAYECVTELHSLVWDSAFFRWYIEEYHSHSISRYYCQLTGRLYSGGDENAITDDEFMVDVNSGNTDAGNTDAGNADAGNADVGNADAGLDTATDNEAEEQMGDFPMEFDTVEEVATGATSPMHGIGQRCYLWLRLITSTVQHARRFKRDTPGRPIKLDSQVIKYPMSDRMMKPWQDVVGELAGDEETRVAIVNALRKIGENNRKFATFFENGPMLEFTGRAHCEAVLGCLHSLAKSGTKNIPWAGIPNKVLRTLKTTYSLVAPSKRCCPVCASLLSSLSKEEGARMLCSLTKHSFIFPYALPYGLPQSIRRSLLDGYKDQLRKILLALVVDARKASSDTQQSEAMSVDDDSHMKMDEMTRYAARKWVSRWMRAPDDVKEGKWRNMQVWQPQIEQYCKVEIRKRCRGQLPRYVLH